MPTHAEPALSAFYEADGPDYVATPYTRGQRDLRAAPPWDNRFQHGGPPSALLARALEEPGSFLVRVTVSLLRPVPVGRVRVEVERGGGRTAQRPYARMIADEVGGSG